MQANLIQQLQTQIDRERYANNNNQHHNRTPAVRQYFIRARTADIKPVRWTAWGARRAGARVL